AGLEVTVPVPLPPLVTVRVRFSSGKVAVTPFAALIVTSHSLAPLTVSQPLQVTGLVLAPGVPLSLTRVPWSNSAAQVAPQLIPAGLEGTVRAALAALVTAW